MPCPGGLVVKNGSQMRCRVAASMPWPVSVTESMVNRPDMRALLLAPPRPRAGAELDRPGLDGDAAALGHGVPRVEHQVHHHLLDLARVGVDHAEVGREPQVELDVLAQDRRQQRLRVLDHRVDVEHPRLDQLAPREGEQLAREVGGPRGRAGDLLDVRGPGIVRLEAPAEQVAEAQDGGEHVVEVVRDPAGEPPDRLQPEALLQAAPRCGGAP